MARCSVKQSYFLYLTTALIVTAAYFWKPVSAQNPCSPTPCGTNTNCDLSPSGAAICRCQSGWNHAPGGNTIDGCPVKIGTRNTQVSRPRPRPPVRPQSPPRRRPPSDAVVILNPTLNSRPPSFSSRPSSPAFNERPCSSQPCGSNAECQEAGGRAVCSCPKGYRGDPYSNCQRNPCEDPGTCGQNAECEINGARAICRCPRGWFGDPSAGGRCTDNPCNNNPCGTNADCENSQGNAICTCRPNYEGDAYIQCELNPCLTDLCGINAECSKSGRQALCSCSDGYTGDAFVRCNREPCYDDPCGPNANCESRNNAAVCTCPPGYAGDPFDTRRGCEIEPCSTGPCGTNAECTSNGRTAICKCPRGYSGDPYTNCRLDPCSTGPCADNAICENSGNAAVCKCPPQHTGDPYINCRFDPCGEDPCGLNADCSPSGRSSICRCVRGFTGDPNSRSGCIADPCSVNNQCGEGATCENQRGRPVCSCPPGHAGNPYERCVRGDCVSNSECALDKACKDYNCVNPCDTSCGRGADCTPQNHVAICRCPRGNTGDPFQACRRFTKDEICEACGANTDCEVGPDDTPICKCSQGYVGNPLQGCRHECETSRDCSPSQECERFKCKPVCREGVCGESANCQARNNRAECSCPPDFLGDGYTRCYTECTKHDDCSLDQACVKFKCRDPCREPDPNVCGQGANCEVKNHKPICSCPRGYTGDPFQSCRKFTREDLCQPNPCGDGAQCQPGTDRSGSDRPVCTCPKGTRGDPLRKCTKGECQHDAECGSERACYDFRCVDPCADACGQQAQCRARSHGAVCSCPQGYIGDPATACRQNRNSGFGSSNRRSDAGFNVIGQRYRRFIDDYLPSFF